MYSQAVIRGRKAGKTYREIAEDTGTNNSAVARRVRQLYKAGRLSYDEACGYRGQPRTLTKCSLGPAGGRIYEHLTHEECDRLVEEVKQGGYAGYNELFVELFRDWVAEKDVARLANKMKKTG